MEFLEILAKIYKIKEVIDENEPNLKEYKKLELKSLLQNLYTLIRKNNQSDFFDPLLRNLLKEYSVIFREDLHKNKSYALKPSNSASQIKNVDHTSKSSERKFFAMRKSVVPRPLRNFENLKGAAIKTFSAKPHKTLDILSPYPGVISLEAVTKKSKTAKYSKTATALKDQQLNEILSLEDVQKIKNFNYKSALIETITKIDSKKTREFLTSYPDQYWRLTKKFNYGGVEPTTIEFNSNSEKIAIGFITWPQPQYNVPINLRVVDLSKKTDTNLHGHYNTGSNSRIYTTVSDVEFIDEDLLLSCSYDKTIKLWDSESACFLGAITTPTKRLNKLALTNNKEIVVASADNGLFFNRLTKSTKISGFKTEFDAYYRTESKNEINDIMFNPNTFYNNNLYCAYSTDAMQTGSVSVVDINSLKEKQIVGIKNEANSLDISSDGHMLVVGTSGDEVVYVYDIKETHNMLMQVHTKQKEISVSKFSRCGTFIATCAEDNSVSFFDLRFFSKPLHYFYHKNDVFNKKSTVNDGLWSQTGVFYSAGGDGVVNVWGVKYADPLIKSFRDHDGSINCMQMSRDNDMLMVGCDSGTCFLYSNKNIHEYEEGDFQNLEQ